MLKILPMDKTVEAVAELMKDGGVAAPVERDGCKVFERLVDASDAVLDERQSVHSARSALFPSRDPMLRFDLGAGTWNALPQDAPKFLLGLHPCDTWGLEAFDLWMKDGIPDDRYASARADATVIAVECAEPCGESSYCGAMGTWRARSADVLLTADESRFLVEALTDKGRHVLSLWKNLLKPGDAASEKCLAARREAAKAAFRPMDGFRREELPAAMKKSFSAPWWHDMAERCLDCGQCVAVCPTCTCFAMKEEADVELKECVRCRVWDACMFAPFAEVAGGHNFRRDRHARIRHRMNRKGNWLNERFGVPYCTGCGRCVTTCPVEISPWKVFRRALGEVIHV